MEKNEFPADLRRFVLTSVPSIPHLEALMLLRSSAPERWSVARLAERLYVTHESAAAVVADLSEAGMLRGDASGSVFFDPESADQQCALIDQLSALYATHLVELTLLIHSKAHRH